MWIEIRCDRRTSPAADGNGRERCYSHDNDGPMGESSDNQKAALQVVRGLEQEAKETGWAKTRDGWVCPYCAKNKGVKP